MLLITQVFIITSMLEYREREDERGQKVSEWRTSGAREEKWCGRGSLSALRIGLSPHFSSETIARPPFGVEPEIFLIQNSPYLHSSSPIPWAMDEA